MTPGPSQAGAEHVLADGTRVTIRPIRPDDGDELRRAFARLSPTSRYRRFFVQTPRLTDETVRYLTHVDGQDHVALVATTDSNDLKSEIGLGVARFVRLADDPSVADAAITVVDEAQGKGIGRLLLSELAAAARERGVRSFRGDVLVSNGPMRHLLEEAGATVREGDEDALVFDVPLDPPDAAGAPEDQPLRRLLRLIAETIARLRTPA